MEEFENMELFLRYTRKEMSAYERTAFEARMEAEPSLKEEFELYQFSNEALVDLEMFKAKEILDSFDYPATPKKGQGMGKYFLGIGLVVVTAVGVTFYGLQEDGASHTSPQKTEESTLIAGRYDSPEEETQQIIEEKSPEEKVLNDEQKPVQVAESASSEIEPIIDEEGVVLEPNDSISNVEPINSEIVPSPKLPDTTVKITLSDPVSTVDCDAIDFFVNWHITPSCRGEATGSILISGGTKASEGYSYALNDSTDFGSGPLFEGLDKGTYTLYVKDEHQCLKAFEGIEVKEKTCLPRRVDVIPSQSVFWDLSQIDQKGQVSIVNRQRVVVHAFAIEAGSTVWEGMDGNGRPLEQGLYSYVIRLENGEILSGSIAYYP